MTIRLMVLVLIATLGGCANVEVAYDHETKMLWLGQGVKF